MKKMEIKIDLFYPFYIYQEWGLFYGAEATKF